MFFLQCESFNTHTKQQIQSQLCTFLAYFTYFEKIE
jgi:uncharacterized protein (DUF1501 family)